MEYADYCRRFYGIDDGVTLIFLPPGSFESWPDITPEQWGARTEFAPSKDYVPTLPYRRPAVRGLKEGPCRDHKTDRFAPDRFRRNTAV